MSKTPVKPTPKKPVGKEAPKAAAPRVWKAEDYVSSHASLEVVKETKSAFDIFDIDGSGLIDVNELITAFCSLGFDLANKISLTQLNNLLENNPDGLDFGHFLNLSTQRLGDSYSRAEINKIFSAFDTSRAGNITVQEFKALAQELGQYLTDEEAEKIFLKTDLDGDGLVTSQDFYIIMTGANKYQ